MVDNLLNRIATFSANVDAFDNPLQMARSSLFYDGCHIVCIFCCLKVPVIAERPMECHALMSPECVTGGIVNDDAANVLRETRTRLRPSTHLNVRVRQPRSSLAQLNVDVRALLHSPSDVTPAWASIPPGQPG